MSRIVRGTLVAALSLLLLFSGSGLAALEAQVPTTDGDMPRTVTTSGLGVAMAEPDQATVRLGVEVQADTAIDAFDQANEQTQALIDALLDAGIAEENIQTRVVRLVPVFGPAEDVTPIPDLPGVRPQGEVIGYRATNLVRVMVETIEDVGPVLDAAVEAGGNVIQGVSFGFADATEVLNQAREEAFADAMAKAMQLAELANASLGEVLSINDFSRVPVPVADIGLGGGGLEAAPVIEPGLETITVDLQVTWRLVGGEDGTPMPGATVTPDTTATPETTVTPEMTVTPETTVTPGTTPGAVAMEPSVTVENQTLGAGDTVVIAEVVAAEPGWIVIHADDDGSPGPDIGWTAVEEGVNEDVEVVLDQGDVTERLYAMLHIDAGVMGTYEFPGADIPARAADGAVVVVPFDVEE
jgi:uncharacterized protein YggE